MYTIQLTRGYVAVVDDEFAWLDNWKWHATSGRGGPYAVRCSYPFEKNKPIKIQMHRIILGLSKLDSRQVDHRDHNTLNNTRSNLRIATRTQNMGNRKKQDGSSRYRGVSWDKQYKRWRAAIRINGRSKTLGRYLKEEEAAMAYDKAALDHFGEYANVNFDKVPA